jgi:hypothetical protein
MKSIDGSPQPALPPRAQSDEQDEHDEHGPATLLEQVLGASAGTANPLERGSTGPLLAEVLDTHNPYMRGRVFVRWHDGERGPIEAWLRIVEGVRARKGAQVLLSKPANAPEWLVTAALFAAATEIVEESSDPAPELLRLEPGQVLRIEDHRGQAVVELGGDQAGPRVRLLGRDATMAVDGTLRLEARELELCGREGVELRTEGEVLARGRVNRLN